MPLSVRLISSRRGLDVVVHRIVSYDLDLPGILRSTPFTPTTTYSVPVGLRCGPQNEGPVVKTTTWSIRRPNRDTYTHSLCLLSLHRGREVLECPGLSSTPYEGFQLSYTIFHYHCFSRTRESASPTMTRVSLVSFWRTSSPVNQLDLPIPPILHTKSFSVDKYGVYK